MADFKMSSNRPYLLRAMYEWIIDNQCTPHLLVDTRDERVKVPREHVRDDQIVLNINPSAVGQFHWDNDHVEFSARFAGVARSMWIPMTSVLAIYARENGEGMAFTVESERDEAGEADEAGASLRDVSSERSTDADKGPALQNERSQRKDTAHGKGSTPIREAKPLRDVSSTSTDDEPTPPASPPSGGGRSHLKIVK